MRNSKILGMLAFAAIALAPAMKADAADLLIYEGFDYPNGDLVLSGAWTGTAVTGEMDIITGDAGGDNGGSSLEYPGLVSSGGRLSMHQALGANHITQLLLPAPITGEGNSLFVSFLLKYNDAQGIGTTYFLHLRTPNSPQNQIGRWQLRDDNSGAQPQALYAQWRGGGSRVKATDLISGTTVFIVSKFTMVPGADNDTHTMWINPTFGGPEPAPSAVSLPDPGNDITATEGIFGIRHRIRGTTNIQGEMDELRMGTTWESVTTNAAPSSVEDWRNSSLPQDPTGKILSSLSFGKSSISEMIAAGK